ncbi:MAG: AraC family transcriptional regulator [Planctomycetota bacterium]|nr:AraC family transcriptional regulator [Planctomycetota bacterium]
MKTIRETVHDVIAERVIPWIERDGISKLILPEQITPDDCIKEPRCDRYCPPGHREHDMAIGLTGRTVFCIENKAFVFTPGRIVLLPGGTSHMSAYKTWYRSTYFDPEWPNLILGMMVYPFGVRVQVVHIVVKDDAVESTSPYMLLGRHFSRLISDLLEEVRSRPPHYAEIGRCILMEFMHRCLRAEAANPTVDITFIPPHRRAHPRNLAESGSRRTLTDRGAGRKKTGKPSKTDSVKDLPMYVQVAQDFIHANYYTQIGMNDIAHAAHMSVDYFGRHFKASTGVTPIQYLLNVRMEAARELILTDLKVSDIARMVGIEDPYYFSRVFRRANGLPPLQYRRKMAKVTPTGPPPENPRNNPF